MLLIRGTLGLCWGPHALDTIEWFGPFPLSAHDRDEMCQCKNCLTWTSPDDLDSSLSSLGSRFQGPYRRVSHALRGVTLIGLSSLQNLTLKN